MDLPKGGTHGIGSWNYLRLVLWKCTNRSECHRSVFAVIWGGLKSRWSKISILPRVFGRLLTWAPHIACETLIHHRYYGLAALWKSSYKSTTFTDRCEISLWLLASESTTVTSESPQRPVHHSKAHVLQILVVYFVFTISDSRPPCEWSTWRSDGLLNHKKKPKKKGVRGRSDSIDLHLVDP